MMMHEPFPPSCLVKLQAYFQSIYTSSSLWQTVLLFLFWGCKDEVFLAGSSMETSGIPEGGRSGQMSQALGLRGTGDNARLPCHWFRMGAQCWLAPPQRRQHCTPVLCFQRQPLRPTWCCKNIGPSSEGQVGVACHTGWLGGCLKRTQCQLKEEEVGVASPPPRLISEESSARATSESDPILQKCSTSLTLWGRG